MILFLKGTRNLATLVHLLHGFHMSKPVERCVGKFVEVSRIEKLKTNTFGVKVMESIINDNQYDQALLRGFLINKNAL